MARRNAVQRPYLTLLLPDALIWEWRDRTLADLAAHIDARPQDVSKHVRSRGYRRTSGRSEMVEAPCRKCGAVFDVTPDTLEQLCGTCLNPPPIDIDIARYEMERDLAARRRDRRREWIRSEMAALNERMPNVHSYRQQRLAMRELDAVA